MKCFFLRNGKFYFYHYAFSKRGFGGYNGIGRMRLTSKFLHKVVTYIQVSSVFKLNLSEYAFCHDKFMRYMYKISCMLIILIILNSINA